MNKCKWLCLAVVLALAVSAQAQFSVNYTATANTDVAGPLTLSYGIDGSGNLTGNSLANSAETLAGNSPFLSSVASFMTVTAYNLNGVAPAIVADGVSSDFLEANVSGGGWDTSGLSDIGFRFKSGGSVAPGTGNNTWPSASELMIVELTTPAGIGTMTFGFDGTVDNVYFLVGDTDVAHGRNDFNTETLFPGESRTLLMWNKNAGGGAKRINSFSVDFTEAASTFDFTLTPSNELIITTFYPSATATNDIIAEYVAAASGVDVLSVTPSGDSNEFSVASASSFSMTDSTPSNYPIDMAFNAALAGNVGATNGGWQTTGSVAVVYTEIGSLVTNTDNVTVIGRFRNPDVKFNIDSSLSMNFDYPAIAVTNNISVSYVEGKPGHTNVEVIAVNILDASTNGFSTINPGVIANPEPSNAVISVTFDNSGGQLAGNETATAIVEVVWGEVGGSTSSTSSVPVSAKFVNLPEGVIQLRMTSPVAGVDTGHGQTIELNDFASFTNKWYGQNVSYDAGGYLVFKSTGNNRSSVNIIENGTTGQDNFGPVDTVALTNGLYRYDFEYEVTNADTNDIWSFDAYALVGQQVFPPSNNTDYVEQDLATGNVEYKGPAGNGLAYPEQHSNGSLRGSNAVGRTTGSVILNVDDGMDAMFHVTSSGGPNVRLYELTLTRVGEYEPPVSPTNAVLDAAFNDESVTNSIQHEPNYDYNDTNVNVWAHGVTGGWANNALKNVSSAGNSRSFAIVTRAGTAGYDDVGVQDTIALTSGTYSVSMDLTFAVVTNIGHGSVTVFSFGGVDATGNVNDVRVDLAEGTNVAAAIEASQVPQLRGSAFFTELARKDYTNNVTETLLFTDLSVQDGEDLCIRITSYLNADFNVIDNVQVLRTGDAPLVGYAAWIDTFGLTGNDALLTTDVEPDGLDNLLEYALGGIPNVDDAATVKPGTFTALDMGTNWFYHVHNERTDDPRLSYTVARKGDLVFGTNWTTGAIEFVDESAAVGNIKSVTNRTDIGAKEFIRLKVDIVE